MSFLSDLASLVKNVLMLGKELEQNRADIREVRRDLQELALKVEQIAGKVNLTDDREASEREKLALQLQVA